MPAMIPGRLALLSLLLTACTAVKPTPQRAQEVLNSAERLIADGAPDAALVALEEVEDDQCPKRLRDRRDVLVATAELARGEPWRAYLALEEFADLYPYSERRGTVVDILWQAGTTLIERDSGFLFFWSDRSGGRTVLEHLITRHPETERLADALRILGDLAFDAGDYELAQERYRDIIMYRPLGDWRFYAQFRYAMSIVASLRGPDYDMDRMRHATKELTGFLDNASENPQMREEAERALELVLSWRMQRHLDIADYYATLDNDAGRRLHLEYATSPEFATLDGYEQAVERRRAFEVERLDQPVRPGRSGVPADGPDENLGDGGQP